MSSNIKSTSMHLYHMSLQKQSNVNAMAFGAFSKPKTQEIVMARGSVLDLAKVDDDGNVVVFSSVDTFSCGTDSGRVSVLKFEKGKFEKVHLETFGKTGCRRITPGQYLAADPKGRAIMIGALEKKKFVYVMNRDASGRLTISSPLSAHKNKTVTFDLIGIDRGFENPTFAALEVEYEDLDEGLVSVKDSTKVLAYYELDLGLNNVLRKWSEVVSRTANRLIAVPGGKDEPGGVLVLSENAVTYRDREHEAVRALLPRRKNLPATRQTLLVSHASYKQSNLFFILIQSEYGDIYKVSLDTTQDSVSSIVVQYFDTIPTTLGMSITRTGCLFAASEFSNHYLYQFAGLGDDDEKAPRVSSTDVESGKIKPENVPTFEPRQLTNLTLIDDVDSLCPMTDCMVGNFANEETKQIYTLCGKGARSSLRILRHGLEVTELAVTDLPGNPSAVWSLRDDQNKYDKYIVVSFENATLILSVGDTVEEVTDSGLDTKTKTLNIEALEDGSIVQIHGQGLRHVRGKSQITEWRSPSNKAVLQSSCNSRQAALVLQGGSLVYFELDSDSGLLEEIGGERSVTYDISSIDLGVVPEGKLRSDFLAVGSFGNSVRVLSLDPKTLYVELTTQMLPNMVADVMLVSPRSLYVGTNNGLLVRCDLNEKSGKIVDTKKRVLGGTPVSLHRVSREDERILAVSSRSWLCYRNQGRFHMTPLKYQRLACAASFRSAQCESNGITAISNRRLRILACENLGDVFHQTTIPLRYTPRKMCAISGDSVLVIEADHNSVSRSGRKKDTNAPSESQVGSPMPENDGMWASCIQVINAPNATTDSVLELGNNEAALSVTTCQFRDRAEVFVVVGSVKGLKFLPKRSFECSYISVYRVITNSGSKGLQLIHKTMVERGVPYALCEFQGRLLVGVGNILRLYDLGKKQLLRKCEVRVGNMITSIHTLGDRIYVGDVSDGFYFLKYHRVSNKIASYAADITPRFLTRSLQLDYDTMFGADKFGNVFASRVPEKVNDDEGAAVGSGTADLLWRELTTSLVKASLANGSQEVVLAGGVNGGLRVFLPLPSTSDVEFLTHLEMHMRIEAVSLSGRDHLSYRSSFNPVKACIDGDLCECFAGLSNAKQENIASEMDRTVPEILKKLENLRNSVL